MSVWKGEIRLKVRAAAAGPVEFAEPAKVLCVAVRPSAPGRRMRKRTTSTSHLVLFTWLTEKFGSGIRILFAPDNFNT